MNDGQIVDGLKSGDPQAFRDLYHALGQGVLTYLTRVMVRREMAEELTQETFLTVIRKIGFFRTKTDGGLKAWVFRIATHLAFDVLRREKRIDLPGDHAIADPQTMSDDDPERVYELAKFSIELGKALAELTEAQRMAFLLMEQEGMSGSEISRVLGCSENAVKQGIYRARVALRKSLCREE